MLSINDRISLYLPGTLFVLLIKDSHILKESTDVPLIFYFCTGLKTLAYVPCCWSMAPIVPNNFVLKLSVSGCATCSNHRIHQKEVRSELTYCGSGFEPSVLQTLMYDIPLLSKLIVLHPLIYVSFHSSCWRQIVTGRREAIRKLDIRVYYFKT